MRKNKAELKTLDLSILTLDDDKLMTLTLQSYFRSAGYIVETENDPLKAIERIREKKYDILLLDFLMTPLCGDEVVARIRKFNKDIFIILLTGHKSLAPPIKTIRELDIQGYYEKSDRFEQLELLVESCVKSIRQMRTIKKYRDSLNRLVDNVPALYQIQPVNKLLEITINNLKTFFNCEDGFIYAFPNINNMILPEESSAFFMGMGKYENSPDVCSEFYSLIQNTEDHSDYLVHSDMLLLPLLTGEKNIFGIIGVNSYSTRTVDDMNLLILYAKQISSAIINAFLHLLVSNKSEELEITYQKLNNSFFEVVTALRSVVDTRDFYTRGHSDRVSNFAALTAIAMKKDNTFVERVALAGLFHDIGKIGVPDDILLKDSRLTDEEYTEIKKHPSRGRQILIGLSFFSSIIPIVEAHHEWYNGKGYPHGLTEEDIPLEARIISVADAFDAMTSKRRYRSNLSVEQAIDQLMKGRGTQFDSNVADVFVKLLEKNGAVKDDASWILNIPESGYDMSKFDLNKIKEE